MTEVILEANNSFLKCHEQMISLVTAETGII